MPSHSAAATSNTIKKKANLTLDEAYVLVYHELEERNIDKNLSHFAEK